MIQPCNHVSLCKKSSTGPGRRSMRIHPLSEPPLIGRFKVPSGPMHTVHSWILELQWGAFESNDNGFDSLLGVMGLFKEDFEDIFPY
ncbi:hypothetical protein CEXT_784321 [Caerostris extrusa]|uniref:Uncharacterized protein n=1 Tax=Caerostris extrusa TaxID=172846 RepID=A0AAV4R2K7_CAEEX|nr:hypothetical protein CEXT_784321 [Caerostris extrusa]